MRKAGFITLGVVALAAAATAFAASGTPGAAGVGDPFFPKAGNGGYDVKSYSLDLAYHPRNRFLAGTATIAARSTQSLSRFDLDLRDLDVVSVRVNGRSAQVTRMGQELRIAPRSPIPDHHAFRVVVKYDGHPQTVIDPDGSLDGWIHVPHGAWVASEPQGSPSWFPCNDHPSDKARFRLRMTVPRGLRVVSNGRRQSVKAHNRKTVFTWAEDQPMATYLATAAIGRFNVSRSRFDGLHSFVAVSRGLHADVLKKIPAIVRFFQKKFGPYPFKDVGAIVAPSPAGYSLETQTRPIFPGVPDEITLAHELAHQWFGDSVSLTIWPDIWLNEGFATFSEWLWGAHAGGKSLEQDFADTYSTPGSDTQFWNPPPADPGNPKNLFDGTVYVRGAMTLEALRERIGSADFFRILHHWAAEHRHGNATTQQFIDLAESISGQDLSGFFNDWLYTPGKPAGYKVAAGFTSRSQAGACPVLGSMAKRSWNQCAPRTSLLPPKAR